jgi:hypothetical protein
MSAALEVPRRILPVAERAADAVHFARLRLRRRRYIAAGVPLAAAPETAAVGAMQ